MLKPNDTFKPKEFRQDQSHPPRRRTAGGTHGLMGCLWRESRNLDISHNKTVWRNPPRSQLFLTKWKPSVGQVYTACKSVPSIFVRLIRAETLFPLWSSWQRAQKYTEETTKLPKRYLLIYIVSENCTSEQKPGLLQREVPLGKTSQCLGEDGIGLVLLGVAGWQLAGGNGQVIRCRDKWWTCFTTCHKSVG